MNDSLSQFSGTEREAADWLVRRDRGLNPCEQEEFERWLAKDPAHFEIYGEIQATWSMLEETTNHPVRRGGWSTRLAALAGVAAAVAVGVFAWQNFSAEEPATEIARARAPRVKRMELPDGSEVQLNADSRVEVAYTATERRVILRNGEAHFTVQKNPDRPFVVDANGVAVRAVGTAFNVKMAAQSVEVLVTSGKVRVDDGEGVSLLPQARVVADGGILIAGERTVIPVAVLPTEDDSVIQTAAPEPVEIVALASEEIRRVMAWKEQRIEFVAAPLSEIVVHFNVRNRHQLVIADAALAKQRFGGTFDANDPDTFVRQLEADFGVISESGVDRTVLRSRPD